MTASAPVTRREAISWVFIAVAFLAIAIGFLGLQDAVNQIKDEAAARKQGEQCTLAHAVEPLREIIKFTTKPADTAGLTPERVAVIDQLNASRAKAQAQLLPLIPNVKCPSG